MSRLPPDPFGRARLPATFDRPGRVRLLKEAARLLLDTGTEAGLFTGAALSSWLTEGGSLERDFLRVKAPRGCHHTPQAIAASFIDNEGADDGSEEDLR